jgi:translocation and assembly module TamB
MTNLGRRQLIVLLSALAMVLLGGGVVGVLVAATQSDGGREWIRAQVSREANRGLLGRLHIGKLSGSFLTDLTIDSIALSDLEDSVYIATGRLTVRYDPRDLVDGRFIFRSVEVHNPLMITRRELDNEWNFRKIFPIEDATPPGPVAARGGFGSLIVLNNITMRGGEVQLTKPWAPDDTLKGAARDSAIAFALSDSSRDIRRVTKKGRRGFQRTWRWADMNAEITRLRFRHPDSTGRAFEFARFDMNETDPPFRVRDMHGTALWRGDTVWFDAPRFTLPGSVGSAKGKVEWPTGDAYWDVALHSDSTALEDIHWIYPTLPRKGYGSMNLRVKSRANPDILDYVITEMDVRSEGSRLRGNMTYGVGGPVLEVRDVSLSLEPADFHLLETLNGVPFPYPWRGTITGRVEASGGPVTHWMVEKADLEFTDRNVPGATAKGTGRGELDILFPGFLKFHSFALELDHFDLRTGQYLNPLFPRLNGHVSGTATLDSMWMDVRLRDADLVHRDGDSVAPSRIRGTARVTMGDDFVYVDANTAVLPLSADAIAKSYPVFPLRGEYRGTLRAIGTIEDLAVSTDLVGDGGRVQFDGRIDGYEPGYAAVARGTLSGFDFRRGFGWASAPPSNFDGRFALDVSGDSLANLRGTAQLIAERSMFDSIRVFGGRAFVRFGNGLMRVDSSTFESVAGTFSARGALGLVPTASDTLRFQFTADSLGGLRRYVIRNATDSLAGGLRASGVLTGQVNRFALDASVEGSGLLVRTTSARQARATFALSSLPDSATGAVTVRVDGLRSGTIAYDDIDLRGDISAGTHARLAARLTAPSGTRIGALADVRRRGDTTIVRLDSLGAATTTNVWSLARAATIVRAAGGFRLDSLAIAGATGGRIALTGRTTSLDTVALTLRADAVPLADVGELMQTREPMAGRASLRADLRGTTSRPDIFFNGSMTAAQVAGFRFDQLDADGRYADRRLTTSLALARGGVPTLHADGSLPLDLAFEPLGSRFPEDPLTAHIRSDSAGLDLLEAFFPAMRNARGALRVDMDVSGTWRHPRATGSLSIANGSFGLRSMGLASVVGLDADIGFLGDSIAIRRFSAFSSREGAERGGSATIEGGLSIRDATDPSFARLELTLQRFNVMNDPRVADLDLTGALTLSGRRSGATLGGGFTVDRGEIRLPELYQKRVISLEDYRLVDTTALVNTAVLATGDTVFINNLSLQNVTIRMGENVWLRSEEANIGLGGSVRVTRERARGGPNAGRAQLVLEGPLQTTRGTYRLNLGPVQRSFAVQSGEVRFYGDPDFNATLNIDAQHVVRQVSQSAARPDVRVNVHIGGTRLSPTAELSTPDSVRVTRADLISYLTTGGPSSEISGRGGAYGTTATRALVTSFGSYLGGKVSGGICDDAQFATTQLDAYGGARPGAAGVLSGTRFNCAKQLSDRLFVRLDAGLCQVGKLVDPSLTSQTALRDAFGVKLDYRLSSEYLISAGVEPPTSAVSCREDAGARGFVPTPQQIGFDLFRLWRF